MKNSAPGQRFSLHCERSADLQRTSCHDTDQDSLGEDWFFARTVFLGGIASPPPRGHVKEREKGSKQGRAARRVSLWPLLLLPRTSPASPWRSRGRASRA